jgi:RNA polymerase sigma factor (sigma-70 family)
VSNPLTEEELLRHAPMVYNLALRLTGSAADAEDLAQDSLLRALKALPEFRSESSPSTWLYRITVNTWKNRVRSEKRRGLWKMVPIGLFGGGDQDEPGENGGKELKAEEPALDAGLETEEAGQAVQKALLTLDEDSRSWSCGRSRASPTRRSPRRWACRKGR